ncbi:MAG: cytochrome c-type biogenesis protein CcmH [Oceanicoccus sp.]|jgi:cytochrome c-type biogenesis protein CcmH
MRFLISVLLLGCSLSALAVVETYEFGSDADQARYYQFVLELRCPKCQNQNLEGSNSPIAKDLRRELHRLIDAGQNDQQIVDYMVSRYGDFILYRPRFTAQTAVLWLSPIAFVLIGSVIVVMVFRRQRTDPSSDQVDFNESSLTTAERQRLDALLAEKILPEREQRGD